MYVKIYIWAKWDLGTPWGKHSFLQIYTDFVPNWLNIIEWHSHAARYKHSKKSKFPPSNRDYNFQTICHIINFITLLRGEFNNAQLDTSFASIDPKIMKLHPIEGTYPGIWKLH